MKVKRIKLIPEKDQWILEEEVNRFLATVEAEDIIDIQFTQATVSNQQRYSCLIVYTAEE